MSKRISRKNLLAEGQRLDGIKLDGNCYQFENAIHFISCLKDVPSGSYLCGANDDRINNIIAEIKKRIRNLKDVAQHSFSILLALTVTMANYTKWKS